MSDMKLSLIQAVKDHAKAHYNEGGWDYVVECYEDSDIEEVIGHATTKEEAIRLVGEEVAIRDDMRKDIQAEADSCMSDDVATLPTDEYNRYLHCTCQDADDHCDFCSYQVWMYDLKETGSVCEDGGFRPWGTMCDKADHFYHTSCFPSQEALDTDIPF